MSVLRIPDTGPVPSSCAASPPSGMLGKRPSLRILRGPKGIAPPTWVTSLGLPPCNRYTLGYNLCALYHHFLALEDKNRDIVSPAPFFPPTVGPYWAVFSDCTFLLVEWLILIMGGGKFRIQKNISNLPYDFRNR